MSLLFFIVFILPIVKADFGCVQLDYLYNQYDCCSSLGQNIPCLQSLPKSNFDDLVTEVRDTLNDIKTNYMPYVPKIITKNLTTFCHNDIPIIGGVDYDTFTDDEWFNKPDLYCNGNENRLVIIPRYHISHCFFSYEFNNIKYTAKIPYNPQMTTESYHKGTQSKTITGFCHYDGDWQTTAVMSISAINTLVQQNNGIIYETSATNNHALKYPCTSELEKIIGDDVNRVTSIPLCTDFQYLNQQDCEDNVAVGAWDHSLPVQMMDQWHTIDLHKEPYIDGIYFTRESGSSYLRFCLTTEYDNPDTYINGFNYGFDNSQDSHKININGR